MFNFFKKKGPKIKAVYVLTFTAEAMNNDTLTPVLDIAEIMLQEKNTDFSKLWEGVQEDTPKKSGNYLYNAEMHNPQTMQTRSTLGLVLQST